MNAKEYFFYKILVAFVIIIFSRNINICSADNPPSHNIDQQNYAQNNRTLNPNLPNAAFGQELNINQNTLKEPLPLPLPPKPATNYKKNNQLQALKNSISNKNYQTTNNNYNATTNNNTENNTQNNAQNTTATYNRNKITPTPIKLANAEIINQQTNNNENIPTNIPENIPENNNEFNAENNNANIDQTNNTKEQLNVTKNQKTQNPDPILDQKFIANSNDNNDNKLKKPRMPEFFGPVVSVVASLLIVISAFLLFALVFKKISPNSVQNLPKEVFENLGKTSLSQKLQVYLLRLGNRLILVSATNDTLTPITEISDPDEVVAVLGMCRQLNNNAINKFHKNLESQLNINQNNQYAKNTTKNYQNDYFGIEQTEQNNANYKPQHHKKIDVYNEPDNSLAAILASGFERKRT
ncbi:MAG: hypothetical protein LBP59_07025 [Planctomycetaceae bacterium]|jgi:flagellar biogenesis protein FliO|nr:hypothetical protein [Planctomycetaceae bacterium]